MHLRCLNLFYSCIYLVRFINIHGLSCSLTPINSLWSHTIPQRTRHAPHPRLLKLSPLWASKPLQHQFCFMPILWLPHRIACKPQKCLLRFLPASSRFLSQILLCLRDGLGLKVILHVLLELGQSLASRDHLNLAVHKAWLSGGLRSSAHLLPRRT